MRKLMLVQAAAVAHPAFIARLVIGSVVENENHALMRENTQEEKGRKAVRRKTNKKKQEKSSLD